MARPHGKQRRVPPREKRPALSLAEMDLEAARGMLREGRPLQALRVLRILLERNPTWVDALREAARAYFQVEDGCNLARVSEQLLESVPDDPEIVVYLAQGRAKQSHYALALEGLLDFLERFPDHEEARSAREMRALCEVALEERMAAWDLPRATAVRVLRDQELLSQWASRGEHALAREAAERVLAVLEHVPTLNTLSCLQWEAGETEAAIATAERVLDRDPANPHALANQVRFLFLQGQEQEAREAADRLKSLPFDRPDACLKKAEAFSFLGDDPAVLEVWGEAERDLGAVSNGAVLLHLAAVATCRLGQESDAAALWQRAIDLQPTLPAARANLEDLRRPPGKRLGPWAFPTEEWLPEGLREELSGFAFGGRPLLQGKADAEWQEWLRAHPRYVRLMPHLLARGDETAMSWALSVALQARSPETDQALVGFVQGQHGSDEVRIDAAGVARALKLIPRFSRLWVQGSWRENAVGPFEVTPAPTRVHAPEVADLLKKALSRGAAGDHVAAEALLARALELAPGALDLRFNLASSLEGQGRSAEAREILTRLNEEDPTYVMGAIALAYRAMVADDLERARGLLGPVDTLDRLHASECSALCRCHVVLHSMEHDKERWGAWMRVWEASLPNDPELRRHTEAMDEALRVVRQERR